MCLHHTSWHSTSAIRWLCCTNHTLLLRICGLLYHGLCRTHVCIYRIYSSSPLDTRRLVLNNMPPTNSFLRNQTMMNNTDWLVPISPQMRMALWPASVELQTVFSFHTPMCCVFANKKPPKHFRWLEVRNNYQELWAYSIYSATLQPLGWGWRHQKTKHRMDAKSIRCRNLYRLYFMPHSAVILIKGFDTPPMEHPPAKEY